MKEWIPCEKKMPRRYQNVWITTHKDKVIMAYLDTENEPRWHDIKAGKTYSYEKVTAWMDIEVPTPYKRGELIS